MKKFLVSVFSLCLLLTGTLSSFAQQAEGINYQAVIRNASGVALATQAVNMRFSILSGSASGTVVYSEVKGGTTNTQGVLSTVIGTGTASTGVWKDLTWVNGPFFIKVEADPAGGTTFVDLGTSQLVSVPMAKQAGGVVLFEGGTSSPDKMIVAHSYEWPDWGMQYNDTIDAIEFVAGGNVTSTVELSSGNVTVNEINRTSTGSANLVPVAYGTINASGTILSGTGNFTVTKTGTGSYSIALDGQSFLFSNYTTLATIVGTNGQIATNSVSGNLLIYTSNAAGTAGDQIFQFVTYKN
ncbi:MAG: hypothetical protein KA149_04480 [Chitinophagales bacterium]|nr:hypothetical protein [Chitinophagales bacterium]